MRDPSGNDLKRRVVASAWKLVAPACALVGVVTCVGVGSASAATPRVKVGARPRLPQGARQVGTTSASKTLHVTVALAPRDPLGLHAFASAVSTPGSPDYRHYLTVGQFAQRYGATSAAVAQVESTLRSEGLHVGAPAANHLTLPVTGTVAKVDKAFAVSERQVRLHGGRVAYANAQAPKLPASAADHIQSVIGLDNLTMAKPMLAHAGKSGGARAHARSAARAAVTTHASARSSAARPQAAGTPSPCSAAQALQATPGTSLSAGPEGYTADQIGAAYGTSSLLGAGDTGAGQTIAMFELESWYPSDAAAYQACYGTHAQVSQVNVDGGGSAGSDGGLEPALDVELATTSAPGANVLVYDAPNSGQGMLDEWSAIISQDQAKVVSTSWGACEAAENSQGFLQSENTLFEEAAAQGQTVLAAAGDSGSAACSGNDPADTSLSVSDPASQPFVTGVGGTSLYTGSNSNPSYYTPGTTPAQGVWNDGPSATGASATGGGVSAVWGMPSYQSTAASGLGVINAHSGGSCGQTYCREVPDVSFNADPNTGYVVDAHDVYGSGWTIAGGTSAAAPMWAAYIALANAQSSCRGLTVGFANPLLYQTASAAYSSDFEDVANPSPISSAADNDGLGVNGGLYPVTANYDMTTGLGTLSGANLAPALCAAAAPVYSVTVANPGTQQSTVGTAVTLPIAASDSGGASLTYSATGLPAGLAINPTTGVISGTPTTVQTTTVTVSASDRYTNAGSTTFTWSVAAPPPPPPPPPAAKAKLQVSLSASPKHPTSGGTLTYTIRVRNRGTKAASNARLTDKVTGKRTIVSANRITTTASRTAKPRASTVKCSHKGSVSCKLGTIGAGKSVTVRVKVKPSRAETLKDTATATASGAGRVSAHLTSHVAAAKKKARKANKAKFRVSVVPSTRHVKVGQKVTYRITVRTVGHVTAHNVKVCDHVPAGLAVISADHAKFRHGQACWTVKTLKPGHAIHRTISFRALGTMRYSHALGRATRAATRTVVNRVTVTATNGGGSTTARGPAVTVTLRPPHTGGVTG